MKAVSYFVYVYRDPTRNNERFYIGKGTGQRHLKHLKRTDHCEFVHRIQKIKRNGFAPLIEFICANVDEEFAFLVEIEAIAYYGRKDCGAGTLLNLTGGGDGVPQLSPEIKAKQTANIKATMSTPASKERQSKAQKLSSSKQEVRAKRSASARRVSMCQEIKAKRSTALKAVFRQPEVKQKHAEAMKRAYSKPEVSLKVQETQEMMASSEVFRVSMAALHQSRVTQLREIEERVADIHVTHLV